MPLEIVSVVILAHNVDTRDVRRIYERAARHSGDNELADTYVEMARCFYDDKSDDENVGSRIMYLEEEIATKHLYSALELLLRQTRLVVLSTASWEMGQNTARAGSDYRAAPAWKHQFSVALRSPDDIHTAIARIDPLYVQGAANVRFSIEAYHRIARDFVRIPHLNAPSSVVLTA